MLGGISIPGTERVTSDLCRKDESVEQKISIGRLIAPERVIELRSHTKAEALEEMIEAIATAPEIISKEEFRRAIFEREKIMSTGIGLGIAVPHAKIDAVRDFVIAVGISREGIAFDSLDDKPVHLVVMIAASDAQKDQYVKVLAAVVLLLKNEEFRKKVLSASSPEEVYALLKEH